MAERVECIVVGAGVIGLAIARHLAMRGRDVIVLEKRDAIGTEVSSRSSEVIHAGIYYPKDSLKARLCVAGKHLLYEFCADHGVAHRRIGKLIVAVTDEELDGLSDVRAAAHRNGVTDVEYMTPGQVREFEPAIRCVGALISPSTGIIDSHGLMLALQGDAEDHGTMVAFLSHLTRGTVNADGFSLEIQTGGDTSSHESLTVECEILINSAGLGAQKVAREISGIPADSIPPLHLARGCYFTMSGASPFRHLIYPMPDHASLGVHVTLDIGGQTRFGPDVEWIDTIDYDVDPGRGEAFYTAVRRYYPDLPDGALQPGYSGIRPKVQAAGEPAADFVIQGPQSHGVPGLVNLFGMESPGLTAALAVAEHVSRLLEI